MGQYRLGREESSPIRKIQIMACCYTRGLLLDYTACVLYVQLSQAWVAPPRLPETTAFPFSRSAIGPCVAYPRASSLTTNRSLRPSTRPATSERNKPHEHSAQPLRDAGIAAGACRLEHCDSTALGAPRCLLRRTSGPSEVSPCPPCLGQGVFFVGHSFISLPPVFALSIHSTTHRVEESRGKNEPCSFQ